MLKKSKHGVFVGINRENDDFLIKLIVSGKLTHADYEFMVPMIENAIREVKKPNIKFLVDALELEGWELRALWDDFKFGMETMGLITKIAFVGNKTWEEYAIKITNFFMIGGEMKYFSDMEEAKEWLMKSEV